MPVDGGLRKLFHKNLPGHFQAIETGGVGTGIPDSNFCIEGVEGWIEFKAADHWRVKISPHQVAWIERRQRNGGRVFIAVRRARDELWLFRAMAGRRLLERRVDDVERSLLLGTWQEGVASWDWARVKEILVKSKV
jgi:hypothetical protein